MNIYVSLCIPQAQNHTFLIFEVLEPTVDDLLVCFCEACCINLHV